MSEAQPDPTTPRPPIQWGKTHHYTIRSFGPPDPGESRMGMWGFSIDLDPHFALTAMSTACPDGYLKRLTDQAKAIGRQCSGYEGSGAVIALEGLLLTNLSVPGDACGLDVERREMKRLDGRLWPLEYHPHNVDTMGQAAGLLAIWNSWFTTVFATLSVEP